MCMFLLLSIAGNLPGTFASWEEKTRQEEDNEQEKPSEPKAGCRGAGRDRLLLNPSLGRMCKGQTD